jgi:hypothetical protein
MSSEAIFLAPIHGIRIDEKLGRGDRIDESLVLTNDQRVVASLIPAKFERYMGTVERDALFRAGLVVYGKLSGADCPSSPMEAEQFVADQLLRLHQITNTFWMIRDNAIKIENGFFVGPDFASSRIYSFLTSLADGRDDIVTFSRDELRMVRDIHYDEDADTSDWQAATEVVAPDMVSFSRALFFVGAARLSHYMSVKIANYCSAFESLLVSNATELTYRLSQRVAWLLGATPEERWQIFHQLKTAYDIRSKAVHGSYMNQKKLTSDLVSAVLACDNILRAVFRTLIGDPALKNFAFGHTKKADDFEERLLRLTLGEALTQGPQHNELPGPLRGREGIDPIAGSA